MGIHYTIVAFSSETRSVTLEFEIPDVRRKQWEKKCTLTY
jgi:hypothetical protein